jgi:hypothetical protein
MTDQQDYEDREKEILEWIRQATPEQLDRLKEKLDARRIGLQPESSE